MITPEGKNLVFLMSLPRSGSTLLSVLLGSHSRIHSPPEPWLLLPLLHLGRPGAWSRDFGAEHAALALHEFLGKEDLRDLSREFACGAYNRALQRSGKSVFLDKTPRYYHISRDLELLFPAAKRLWLVRNPLDVAASIKSTWKISIAELAGSPLTQHSFDLLLGLPLITAACRSSEHSGMIIRYEELAAQPEETLRAIARFLGLHFEPAMTQLDPAGKSMEAQRRLGSGDRKILRTKSVHTASVGSWEKTLDESELKILARIISPEIMVRLGYQTTLAALEKRGVRLQPEAACRDYRQHALHPTSSKTTAGLAVQIRQLTKLAAHHEAEATARAAQVEKLTALAKSHEKHAADRFIQITQLTALVKQHEAESAKRADQIDQLTASLKAVRADAEDRDKQVRKLNALVRQHETESANRAGQIDKLTALVKQHETESANRAGQVDQLTAELKATAKECYARDKQIKQLTALVKQHETESANRAGQVDQLTALLKAATRDGEARADQIKQLTALVKQHETESANRAGQVDQLTALLKAATKDGEARADQIKQLTTLAKSHEKDAADRFTQITQLTTLIKQHETESANRAGQIDQLTALLKAATKDGEARADQIKQLTALVKQHESESANRAGQIDKLTTLARSYEADNHALRRQIASYAQWLKDAQTDNQALTTAHRGAEMTALAALRELEQLKQSRSSGC